MPGSGASMLRRLFLSPVTIVSYSPDALNLGRREATCKLRGWRYVLKLPKSVPLTYNLRIPLGNRMVLQVSGLQRKFFGQKFDFNMQFG
jgi:hypothetical protein